MLHSLYDALVIFPIPIEFLDIQSWLLFLQSLRKSFVFLSYLLLLLLPEDFVETFIDLGPKIFGLGHRKRAPSGHNTGYLIQQDPIFPIDLIFSDLLDLPLLAVIDGNGLRMLH